MSSALAGIQQKIVTIIKRFKFEELESSVLPVFPETSWNNVRVKLIRHHKGFTSTNVAQLIKIVITEAKLNEKVLNDRLSSLQLIDISWHSTRCMWHGYALAGPNRSVNYLMHQEIKDNIKDYFQSVNMKMDVKVNVHDGIMYVSVKDKMKTGRNKKPRTMLPIVFALFIGQKYFFCTRKNVSADILQAIIQNLGYEKSKRLKLTGRDLNSLSKLCWKKKEGALNFESITKPLVYKDASPMERIAGIDFTQYKQRKEFARRCFGDDPPKLQLLVINGPTLPVIHEDISVNLPNVTVSVTWEFRSRDIAMCLTKLIERRILITPLPYYIANLMVLGKNEFSLREND